MQGSSPLTRGKRPCAPYSHLLERLIPAHAGKTVSRERTCSPHRAHPRSRGENLRSGESGRLRRGSSPLTRGKPPCACRVGVHAGLIPAHAGKTVVGCVAAAFGGAHPRSRGENLYCGKRGFDGRGSSPLTRGKPMMSSISEWPVGLIPAHAGKTGSVLSFYAGGGAHPRSRGENAIVGRPDALMRGSSPLTRGKHVCR